MNKGIPRLSNLSGKKLLQEVNHINEAHNRVLWKVVPLASNEDAQNRLEADLQFKNFKKTWKFLNAVADHAHSVKHHPTLTTTYNKVNIRLTTHDAGNRVTEKDLSFAMFVENQLGSDLLDSGS